MSQKNQNQIQNISNEKITSFLNDTSSGINTTCSNSTVQTTQNNIIFFYNQSLTNSSAAAETATSSSVTRSTTLLSAPNEEIEEIKNKSDQFLSFSPITPIVDYTNNNSGVFSDFSVENNSNTQNNSDKLVYKTIMIIDVQEKSKLDSVYKSEIKLTNSNNIVKNVIRKNFNNFYLLEKVDIEEKIEEHEEKLKPKYHFKKSGKFYKTRKIRRRFKDSTFKMYKRAARSLRAGKKVVKLKKLTWT